MAKDHYLPAAFIGRFSDDTSGPLRKRQIWVHNGKAQKILPTTAASIGYEKGLYDLADGKNMDKWSYENWLAPVLDRIVSREDLTLDDWIHVAVPFVAGLFVRGKEFNIRYEAMPIMQGLAQSGLLNSDNTNGGRAIRLQRILTAVAAARWVVLHNVDASNPIISNDLGLTPTQDLNNGELGWAIPLDTKTVLGIFPRKFRSIAVYRDSTWHATIEHFDSPSSTFRDLNQEMTKSASEFIFGPTKQSLEKIIPLVEKKPEDLAMIMESTWTKTISHRELVAHETDWRRVASIANLNLSPTDALEHEFKVTDMDLKRKWSPPIFVFPLNLTAFPSGVGIGGNDEMCLNLNLQDDFDSHIQYPPAADGDATDQVAPPSK